MRRRDWWPTASAEAREVQVRAAASIGLTARDAAIMFGGSPDAIRAFSVSRNIALGSGPRGGSPKGHGYAGISSSYFDTNGIAPVDVIMADSRAVHWSGQL